MSYLSSLDLRAVSPTPNTDVTRFRLLLMGHLRQQMTLWQHDSKGIPYRETEIRYVTGPSGDREAREIKKKPRRWYSPDPELQGYHFRCYYRYSPIILTEPKNDVVWCDSFDAIPDIIDTLMKAVHAGELDKALLAVRGKNQSPI